jgi:hypothetical protein
MVNGLSAFQYAGTSARRRIGSGALVAALHLLIALALLHMVSAPRHPLSVSSREIMIRMSTPVSPPSRTEMAPPPPRLIQPLTQNPQPFPPPAIAPIPPSDLRGFGERLFNCAPENLAGMTLQERARCGTGLTRPDDNATLTPRSRVKDPERRAAEMAAKNAQARVPCSYIATERSFGYQVPAASLDCLFDSMTGPGLAPLNGLGK